MQRVTISLDDPLATSFDKLVAARGYTSRSEAMRDLVRRALDEQRAEAGGNVPCIANLSYVFDHHVRDLSRPTPASDWVSVAVCSDGSYGVEEGIISSFPVRVDAAGHWSIVQGLKISEFAQGKINATVAELKAEREVIKGLLG